MKVLTKLTHLRNLTRPVTMAIGFFDGMHRGHLRVIQQTINAAVKLGGEAWVLTFDKHPKKVLKRKDAPLLLTSPEHRIQILCQLGLDGCVVLPFNKKLASMMPSNFVTMLKNNCPFLRQVFVGQGWRFGKAQSGNTAILSDIAKKKGFSVKVVPCVKWKNNPISSTRVREAIKKGRLKDAREMLGRPFSVMGKVISGTQIGSKIGYPTANLETGNEIMPPHGVYSVVALMDNSIFKAVANIGNKPTFMSSSHLIKKRLASSLEVHIIGKKLGAVYGKKMEVFFLKYLREEKKFPSPMLLARQIKKDILYSSLTIENDFFYKKIKNIFTNNMRNVYSPSLTNK